MQGPTNPWDAIVDTPPYTYAMEDMVVLIPCATHRHPMVYMTRNLWRKGIKAYVASNGTQTDAVLLHGVDIFRGTDMYARLRAVFSRPSGSDAHDRERLDAFFEAHTPSTEVRGRDLRNRFQIVSDCFQIGSDTFQIVSDSFQTGSDTFQIGSDSFQIVSDSFQTGSDSFRIGSDSFQTGSDSFQIGSVRRTRWFCTGWTSFEAPMCTRGCGPCFRVPPGRRRATAKRWTPSSNRTPPPPRCVVWTLGFRGGGG